MRHHILWAAILCAACSDGADGPPGIDGQPGAEGDPGAEIDPNASFGLLQPFAGPIGRVVRVELLLEELAVDDSTSVDFGPGITVATRMPTGENGLALMISISPDAEVGWRDVTVTSAGETVTGTHAFEVTPAIEVTSDPEKVDQGAVIGLTVHNLDENAFDPDSFTLSAPGVGPLYYGSRTRTYANVGGVVAPLAEPGDIAFTGANSSGITFLGVESATVMERAPIELSDPVADQIIVEPGATNLYRHTVPAHIGFVDVEMRSEYVNPLWPLFWAYDEGGQPEDCLNYVAVNSVIVGGPKIGTMRIPYHTATDSDLYLIATDYGYDGSPGHAFDLRVDRVATAGAVEAATPHSGLPGQTLSSCVAGGALGQCVLGGSIDAPGEVDVYRIDGLAADTYLVLYLSSGSTIEVFAQDGALTAIDPAMGELSDIWGSPTVVTGEHNLVTAWSWNARQSWTIQIRGETNTEVGPYTLGLHTY